MLYTVILEIKNGKVGKYYEIRLDDRNVN